MDFTRHFGPKVTQCERIIGYSFKSKLLCAEAMNAAADSQADYTVDGFIRMMPKNDRLAVYGDTAATFYLAGIWMDRGLEKLTRTSPESAWNMDSTPANGGTLRVSPGMIATAVEAILGALERDGGLDKLTQVMGHLCLTQHALIASVPP